MYLYFCREILVQVKLVLDMAVLYDSPSTGVIKKQQKKKQGIVLVYTS